MTDTDAATEGAEARRGKSSLREYTEAILIALALALFVRTFVVQAFKIPSGSMENTLLVGDHILVNKFIYWFREPRRGDIIVFRFPRDESRDFIKRVVGLPGEEVMVRGKRVFINCFNFRENMTLGDYLSRSGFLKNEVARTLGLDPGVQLSTKLNEMKNVTADNFHELLRTAKIPDNCTPLREPYAVFKPDGVAEGVERVWGPRRVPPGHLLMLGDNRNNSQDSRFWGFLKTGEQLDRLRLRLGEYALDVPFPCSLLPAACWDGKIRGAAFLIYWSWDSERSWPRWGRLGKLIH